MTENDADRSDAAPAPEPLQATGAAHVFICYSHKDAKAVYADIEWLSAAGQTPWYDKELNPGGVWRSELAAAIEDASVVLFYASPDAVASEHCSREINYALDCNVPVIPIYLGETALSADLRMALARVQAIHRHGMAREEYHAQLLSALGGVKTSKTRVMSPPRAPRRIWAKAGAVAAAFIAVIAGTYFLSPRVSEKARVQIGDPAVTSLKSLAVLPFDNLSGDPEQQYFAEGLQDALIGELAQIGALRVISRTSTLGYRDTEKTVPEIAAELGVSGIIEASVMRAGEEVRIQVQLIEAFPEERHLWAQSFDGDISEILAVQSKVAQAVAEQVGATLSDDESERIGAARKVDPSSYEAYLRGVSYINQFTPYPTPTENFELGVKYLERAVDLNPNDPLAYTGLALAYSDLGHLPVPPTVSFPKARDYALRALAIDDTLAGAHVALAEITVYFDWNLVAGLEAFERALELDPNNARARAHYGWTLDGLDRFDEAEAQLKKSAELAPLEPIYAAWLGWWYLGMNRYEEALEAAQHSLNLVDDYYIGLYVIGAVYARQERFEDAIRVHGRLAELYPMFWNWPLGETYAMAGKRDEAQGIIDQLGGDNVVHAWGRAMIYESLGERDQAFQSLRDAARHKHSFIPWIGRNYAFSALKDDPRFEFLTAAVNYGE